MALLDDLFLLLERRGGERYGQEAVSQIDHALQAASLAEAELAPSALVIAALFHDIGHLMHENEEAALKGIDMRHEACGAAFLADWFGPDITRPVRLHVEAKRYLCATEAGYFESLSPASARSLALQGGPLSADEVAVFEADPHGADAARLRRWDEGAKIVGARTARLDYFRGMAEMFVLPDSGRRHSRL
ncbi:MAG: phosphonate degradation HD-domain oxygenase [Alphaproteobacteria bacterium]